ncbi:MAG: MarR family transcriptional regulator [Thermoplasmata archaeon]|nr:MarR family transcriptional regulator [Thermoplasmata archaeon]
MEDDPLALESRRRIYEAIRIRPGISGREVERVADMARGETVYHLERLTVAGLVHREPSGHQDHYFTSSVPLGERTLLRLARSPSARRLLVTMLKEPMLTVPELREKTGLSQARISVHMRRLLETGLVESGREGRLRTFAVTDRARVLRLLVTYREGYADRWVEGLLETWAELFPA